MSASTTTHTAVQWNRIAAVVAWCVGVFTTWLFVDGAMTTPATTTTSEVSVVWPVTLAIAIVGQWLLTIGERPLWRRLLGRAGPRPAPLAALLTLIDGIINAAGIYPYVGALGKTGVGVMLSEVISVQNTMGPIASFSVALLLGVIVAALPEFLWEAS